MVRTLEWLKENIGWVLFTYPDGSQRVVRTTKSGSLLEGVMKDKKPMTIYDLDKLKWVKLPSSSDVKVEIHDERPQLEEVSEFVSKFL